MTHSPRYKLYSADDEYMGSAKYLEDAAAFVAFLGDGSTVRDGHTKSSIIWREGKEAFSAGESYDLAAQTMEDAITRRQNDRRIRLKDQTAA